MHYFSIFSKTFNKPCVNFLRVWTKKPKLLGNFEKILKFFDENSIEKLNFFIFYFYFIFFSKICYQKLNFRNNTIFLQQFFRFRGGGGFPPPFLPPGYALDFNCAHKRKFSLKIEFVKFFLQIFNFRIILITV